MRIGCLVVAVGIILSHPAMAICSGSWPSTVCISDDGSIWGPGYYGSYGYPRQKKGYGTAPIENRAMGSQALPRNSTGPGVTTVLQPNAQSGNAWVAKPQGSGGATVLGQGGTSPQ